MKTNKLTQKEFESILLSIVKLESKETIFTIIIDFHGKQLTVNYE